MPNKSTGWWSPQRRNLVGATLAAAVGCLGGFSVLPADLPPAVLLLPLALALVGRYAPSTAAAWRQGLLVALPGLTVALAWVVVPVHKHGGLPLALALPCPVLLATAVAAYAGLFAAAVYWIRPKALSPLMPLILGALWASLELGRGLLLTGFPWLLLAQALSPWPWALGPAAWIGAYGLSGLLAAGAAIFALWPGWRRLWAAVPLAFTALLALIAPTPQPTGQLTAALIQGNVDQSHKWDPALQTTILNDYLRLSREARTPGLDLVIWPETATPFHPQDPSPLTTTLRQEGIRLGVPLLFGAPAYSPPTPNRPTYVLHNRAYLLDPLGLGPWYDKEHLVPFGEYVPFGDWLPWLSKLVPGDYEFAPSPATAPLPLGNTRLGILICYEAIFPELTWARVREGAGILINLSNDAWFGDTAAPRQHLALTVLRAVEAQRAIFRATNTGITAAVAPDGRIVAAAPQFTATTLIAQLPVLTRQSFYHQHFHAIHGGFVATAILGLVYLRRFHLHQG